MYMQLRMYMQDPIQIARKAYIDLQHYARILGGSDLHVANRCAPNTAVTILLMRILPDDNTTAVLDISDLARSS